MTAIYVALYLAAAVGANLTIASLGPIAMPVLAFVMIGLDLTSRDFLHDAWRGGWLWPKMAGLIFTGSLISYLLNRGAARVAMASFMAFCAAGICDALSYAALSGKTRFIKINGSNAVSALVDSILFPGLAFGIWSPLMILAQYAAKFGGGLAWSGVFAYWERRRCGN